MKLVPTSATRAVGKLKLSSKKNSPHIYFGVGLLGAIGSVYLACKATLELEDTLDEVRADIEEANYQKAEKARNELQHAETWTSQALEEIDKERAKEVSVITFKGAIAVGKLYLPAAIVGGISVACLAGSHVQLTRRNAALTAAFTAITKSFDDYRDRVKAEVGEEKEEELYRGSSIMEITNPDGSREFVPVIDPNGGSIYAKCFDELNPCWRNNVEFNRTFIDQQEKYANHILRREGFIFLNDVYEKLGFEKTQIGQIVGWILNSPQGDGYITFDLFNARNRNLPENEPSLWLDFNVDGVIYNLIPTATT